MFWMLLGYTTIAMSASPRNLTLATILFHERLESGHETKFPLNRVLDLPLIPFYSCPVCVQKFFTHRYNDVPVSVGAFSTQYKTSLGKHVSTSPTTVLTLVLHYVSSLLLLFQRFCMASSLPLPGSWSATLIAHQWPCAYMQNMHKQIPHEITHQW